MSTVGPNAVIQLLDVLGGLRPDALAAVAAAAGAGPLVAAPPNGMVDEAVPRRLFDATLAVLGDDGERVLAAAGAATARSLLVHRIPRGARAVLPVLPAGLALRLLLAAVGRAAWTFAGSGRCATEAAAVTITRNPLATPGCPWHVAVFGTLGDALVRGGVAVRHPRCSGRGDAVCRFELVTGRDPALRLGRAPVRLAGRAG
jgi:divinyl protochlorophyllide a 8-vinyl-reductase